MFSLVALGMKLHNILDTKYETIIFKITLPAFIRGIFIGHMSLISGTVQHICSPIKTSNFKYIPSSIKCKTEASNAKSLYRQPKTTRAVQNTKNASNYMSIRVQTLT
jgi:hypothetical protein